MVNTTAENAAGSTLEHLLTVEAQASSLVNEAQKEADRLIHENEERNRTAYEERIKIEIKKHEAQLEQEKEKIKEQYSEALDRCRLELSGVESDVKKFCALLNEYIEQEG
ncbi:MAG: hypothetical protein FWB95_00860 [Treponema sp.]|nr:hypothetical protein [Treponema sp.]